MSDGRHRLAWVAIFLGGVALRLVLWSGYGLGDDPSYFAAYHRIFLSHRINPSEPYDFRFGIWVPVVLAMRVFGETEIGFIGAITAASIWNLILVHLLARQEWEPPWALLAMALLAVFPLEVVCSTLFANDILLGAWCFTSLWLLRRSFRTDLGTSGRLVSAVGSGVFLTIGLLTKPWVMLMAPLLSVETLRRWRTAWRWAFVAAGTFAALGAAFFAWQWRRFGDPMHFMTIAWPMAIFMPYSRDILLDYPRMLLLRNQYGSWFAGSYPHVLLVLIAAFALRLIRAGRWLAYFLILLAGLAGLPSHRVNGEWVTLVPHIFRYLTFISIPLVLALTAWVREAWYWRPAVGVVVAAGLLVSGVVHSMTLAFPSRDAFAEERRALAVVSGFPDEQLVTDSDLASRYQHFHPKPRPYGVRFLHAETLEAREKEFAAVKKGIVVTGGGRLPWYGCYRCTADLGTLAVPPSWTLVTTFEGRPLTEYRHEPLRVWRVSAAAGEARTLLEGHPDPSLRSDGQRSRRAQEEIGADTFFVLGSSVVR